MQTYRILVPTNPTYGRCPDCKDIGVLRRSRSRSMWEKIVKKASFFDIYRCRKCGWRGYKSKIKLTFGSVKTILLYVALMLVTAIVIRFVLTKFIIN